MRDALKILEYSDSHHIVTVISGLYHVSDFDFLYVLYLVTKSTVEDSPMGKME